MAKEDLASLKLAIQYTHIEIFFSAVKIEKFNWKKFNIFNIFAQNIDCVYMLKPPRRGGSNVYLQCRFWTQYTSV